MTRRSYKRKIITMGISIFSALALFATGFASWVLSSGAEEKVEGNVSVGTVSDNSVTFGTVTIEPTNANISFNPAENDTTGRVRWDGTHAESLSVTFEVPITGYENIDTLTVALQVPDNIAKAAAFGVGGYHPSKDNQHYLVLPECTTNRYEYKEVTEGDSTQYVLEAATPTKGVALLNPAFTSTDGALCYAPGEGYSDTWSITEQDDGTHLLTYTVNFKWGNYFGGQNPSIFFDQTTGVDEDDNPIYKYSLGEAKDGLNSFRAMMAGMSIDDYEELSADEMEAIDFGDFTITVTATAKQ